MAAVLMNRKRKRERAAAFVDEVLEGMELLGELNPYSQLKSLQVNLRLMRTFLMFASMWQNDVPSRSDESSSCSTSLMMGSFLNRLEDALHKGKWFHHLCLAQKNKRGGGLWMTDRLEAAASELNRPISSFKGKIADFSITDYHTLQSGDQLLEVINFLIANMADIKYHWRVSKGRTEVIFLLEKLVFFKNFIRFAQLRGFEPGKLQFLFNHLQVVAVNAASHLYGYTIRGLHIDEFRLEFDKLLLQLKLVDPKVRENYVQALTYLKFSGSSHALTLGADRHVLGDFVDSLLYNILEALRYRDDYIISLNDQVTMLYGGLIFLRTILTNHLEKIDELHEKVKDLIGVAVYEAAIVICPLPVHKWEEGLAREMDYALHNFLEKIKLIKLITSALIFPETNEQGFVEFFFENLKELPSCKVDSIAHARDQIQTVQEDLESVLDQHNQDGKLQSFWRRVAEVARETRFVIESLVVGDIPDRSTSKFDLIKEEINLIKMEALGINDNQYSSEAPQIVTETSSSSPSQGSTPTISKAEGTLDDEAKTIIKELTSGSKQLDIISIVGMPGIGKTTLARSVYDDPSVRGLFHVRAWCVISQVYKKKDLLLQILGYVDCDFRYDNHSRRKECDLEENLKKCLMRKKYLIVLDDVWDTDAWSGLKRSFPNDSKSSRILLTSRHSDVAKKINPDGEPHSLRLLSVEESWRLLQTKLSCKKSYPLNLGMKIAKNCKGLPLTVVIVAGILANLEEDGWVKIAERLSLSDLTVIDQCTDMLEVSYKTLPENLRSCLLYFGAFQEDKEIPCKRLIWLWSAEGFVQKCETESLEDAVKDSINALISRNWLMVSKERSLGGAKTCRIHDLLHEFCMVKAKKEKFMSVLSGHDDLFNFHEQRDLQRLYIHSASEDFEKSRLFCPSVRSLLFASDESPSSSQDRNIPFIFHFCKLLKVLDLININLGDTFPSEIALLVELSYLAIRCDVIVIPREIANLSNLETLLFFALNALVLPNAIWNLSNLRVLQCRAHNGFRESEGFFVFNSDSMPNNLDNLGTFSKVFVTLKQLEELIRKLPNIRKLNCILDGRLGEFNPDRYRIGVMNRLSRLESLHLNLELMAIGGFQFPLNLKKLTLERSHSSIIPKGGELPNLVVLKLNDVSFERDTWDMNEGWEFPKLKYLEINSSRIVRWIGSYVDDLLPCLEKLVVKSCSRLKKVPSCLGEIPNLQVIEVGYCGKFATRLFQEIKEEQKNNWGNDIQVLIENWRGMIHQLASSGEITSDDEE